MGLVERIGSAEPHQNLSTVTFKAAETTTDADVNATTPSPPLTNHKVWIAFTVLESIMLAGSLYLLASLIWHIVTRQVRRPRLQRTTRRRCLNGILLIFVTLYTGISSAKFVLAQAIAYSPTGGYTCAAFAKANRLIHITGFLLLAGFLWFRQYILYNMPQLRHLTAPVVTWWSRFTLLFIAVAAVSGYVIIGKKQWLHDDLCVVSDEGVSASALSGVISSVVVQGSLLALFSLLIVKRWYWRGDLPKVSNTVNYNRTRRLVTKCCILAALCAFTDVSSLIIVSLIKNKVPELVTVLMLDIDQFFNMCCLVLCFATWRNMILPWPCCSGCDLSDRITTSSSSGADTGSASRVFTLTQSLRSNRTSRRSNRACSTSSKHEPASK